MGVSQAPSDPSCVDSLPASTSWCPWLLSMLACEAAIEQLIKDALAQKRWFEHKKKNRKKWKKLKKKLKKLKRLKNIPSIKDVVNLCHGVNTEVHSPRCFDTKWQGPLCRSALYRFSARLSSPVSWEPFARSLSNLDTSITRPFSFEKTKKNRKNSKENRSVSS